MFSPPAPKLLQNRKLLGGFTSGYSSDQSRQSSNNSFPSPAPKFLHNSKPIKDFTSASSSLWLNQDHHPEKNIPIFESRKLRQYYYWGCFVNSCVTLIQNIFKRSTQFHADSLYFALLIKQKQILQDQEKAFKWLGNIGKKKYAY